MKGTAFSCNGGIHTQSGEGVFNECSKTLEYIAHYEHKRSHIESQF